MRKITVLLTAIVLVLAMMVSPAFAADGGSAAVSNAKGMTGEVVEVNVSISGFGEADAVAVVFTVPQGLKLVEEKSAWLVADSVLSDIGEGYAACALEAPAAISGDVLKLAFVIESVQEPH